MKTGLPKAKKDLFMFEKLSIPSECVIVKVKDHMTLAIGQYYHGIEEWRVNGFHRSREVEEWWPLPEIGTGTKTP